MANKKIESPEIVIKKLSKKEVLEFFPIIKILRPKLTRRDLEKRMQIIDRTPEHHFWGAFEGENKIGFCHASASINLSPGGKDLYLNDLIVVKSNRKNGVGRKLLDKIQNLAIKKNCKRILITVRTSNLIALNFYRKNSFERRGWARLVKEL